MLRAITVALLAFSSAATGESTIIVYGSGNDSCGSWLEAHEHDAAKYAFMQGWVLGFVSATAGAQAKRGEPALKGTDTSAIFAYVDKYCRDKPLDALINAAEFLTRELTPKRPK